MIAGMRVPGGEGAARVAVFQFEHRLVAAGRTGQQAAAGGHQGLGRGLDWSPGQLYYGDGELIGITSIKLVDVPDRPGRWRRSRRPTCHACGWASRPISAARRSTAPSAPSFTSGPT